MNSRPVESVLIVGAATPVGRSVSQVFAEEGAELLLTDVVSSHLNEISESIAARTGRQPVQQVLRVTDPEDWAAAIEVAEHRFGRLDLVVNAAELDPGVTWQDATADDWSRAVDINLQGVVLGLAASLPALRRSSGCFAVVSVDPAPSSGQVVRAATRAASREFVRLVQEDLTPEVNIVAVVVSEGSESVSGAQVLAALDSVGTRNDSSETRASNSLTGETKHNSR